MKPQIIGVLGLGIFGRTVAKELNKYGKEVIAIDHDASHVELIADEVTTATVGDFTDFDLLEEIGLANCDVVIIATGTNLESAVLAVMHAKRLGIPKIIAKARGTVFEDVLNELGATTIISPERDSGKRLASKLLRTNIEEILPLDEDTSIIEFKAPEKWVGRNLLTLDLRNQYDMNIIGMRKSRKEKMRTQFDIQAPVEPGTIFIAVTSEKTFEKYDYLNRIK
ncbi:TrkA family potassium uptake protein [Tuanshanicoccus lijuaniae]|uniref:potassium channel family protein n=1 Tax=Aerococcaceae bacterium zg-1292 TaxID=2774330 RepID=UPI001938EF48|nr:TrkA family potassium uptake protein [Aerococcaceae bacterium zg-1292]MBF6625057.1 TrkA family potassium uptake protein [Aerococcaceae bacterium zg-BR9]MBF6978175.1 TrkA family potassium uptake protein [Aerococcaceae bacterium zg-BR22]MBS4456311.1 TrkA family potassium uptake protein [Aerococcaceae bacterium zg-A91]MBS4458102.1 TrkA family potassium uptake protein [Aerococcaceae bacterium zg-BR33]